MKGSGEQCHTTSPNKDDPKNEDNPESEDDPKNDDPT